MMPGFGTLLSGISVIPVRDFNTSSLLISLISILDLCQRQKLIEGFNESHNMFVICTCEQLLLVGK